MRETMKKRSIVVTVVGALLGILCAALAIAAEVKRVKVNKREKERYAVEERERESSALYFLITLIVLSNKDVKTDPRTFNCFYRNSPVGILAMASAGALFLAQIIIHGFAGCICCITKPGRPTGIITWIVFIFAW